MKMPQLTPQERRRVVFTHTHEQITPFMSLPIKNKLKENFLIGSTWNLVISSMILATKFNHDEYEYDKYFAKFF